MQALTLTAPYGTLIALAAQRPDWGKHIETRGWQTHYRGLLAIHQAIGLGPVGGVAGLWTLCNSPPFARALAPIGFHIDRMPRGAIVAVAELIDCVSTEQLCENSGATRVVDGHRRHWTLTEQEACFGDYSPSRFGWLLADIRALAAPVACRGAQRLWTVPPAVAAQIMASLG